MPKFFLLFLLLLQCNSGLAVAAVYGQVSWVHDGDTIEVKNLGRVRLLGIDAPEHEASGRDRFYQRQFQISPTTLRTTARQATGFVIDHSRNQVVRLEFDRERKDQYGRLLAYVYLPDGRLLNLMLIEEGLAAVFRRAEFEQKKQFLKAEKIAQQQQIGMWSRFKPDR